MEANGVVSARVLGELADDGGGDANFAKATMKLVDAAVSSTDRPTLRVLGFGR